MSKKTKAQWAEIWDQLQCADKDYDNSIFNASLELLRQYCGYIPAFNGAGTLGRFFSGRWRTNNGDVVQEAIKVFYTTLQTSSTISDFDQASRRTVDNLLTRLCSFMKEHNVKMKNDGDLNKIIRVIIEKTGCTFSEFSSFITDYPSKDGAIFSM